MTPEQLQQLTPDEIDQHIAALGKTVERQKAGLATLPAQESEGIIDLDPPAAVAAQRTYEGFLAVAMRAHARHQRVLPIAIGAKNPTMKWKGSSIDTDSTEQWQEHSEQWIRECAAKFPDSNACVLAKPGEFCFIDEDASEEFRQRYEKFAGEAFPHTFTTESRPGHRQSSWLQTDATRALGNVSQIVLDDKAMFSFRQRNLYVLSEGSRHPSGSFYDVFDSSPIVPMPDKLVEYMRQLEQRAQQRQPKVGGVNAPSCLPNGNVDTLDATLSGPKIPFGQHDDTLFRIASKIHQAEPNLTADEVDERLIAICEARCIGYGSDYKSMTAKCARQGVQYKDEPAIPFTQEMKDRQAKVLEEQKQREQAKIEQPVAAPVQDAITRETIDREFPAYDGKAPAKPRMIIENFLVGGTSFFGSLPGVGKSWVALSVAKALTTGKNLFGDPRFQVLKPSPVLYLCPESDESTFKYRLGVMKITQDPSLFRYRTVSQGSTLALTDEKTLAVIRLMSDGGRRVLVIIDTAIRFMMEGKDEKSATDNTLAHDAEVLRGAGADVLFLHHSTKVSAKAELTLENALRGTGDFSAMADCVFGMRRDEALFDYSDGPTEIECACVKTRAPEWPKTFRLRLTRMADGIPVSVIDETGDLQIVQAEESAANLGNRLSAILTANAATSSKQLKAELHIGYSRIKKLADEQGWKLRGINTPEGKKTIWSRVFNSAVDPKIEADAEF